MGISDEELVRQLEAVPQVEPPEIKNSILANLRVHRPAVFHRRCNALGVALLAGESRGISRTSSAGRRGSRPPARS